MGSVNHERPRRGSTGNGRHDDPCRVPCAFAAVFRSRMNSSRVSAFVVQQDCTKDCCPAPQSSARVARASMVLSQQLDKGAHGKPVRPARYPQDLGEVLAVRPPVPTTAWYSEETMPSGLRGTVKKGGRPACVPLTIYGLNSTRSLQSRSKNLRTAVDIFGSPW